MRIPIPIAIVLAVLFLAGFWWLRTKDMDFMTPKGTVRPLPEFMTSRIREEIPSAPIALVPGPSPVIPTPPPSNPDQPPLEFGDLESSPGLAEYSEHASRGAGYLIRLATELELQGQWERSLLAWERVIDSCNPSDAERVIAEDSIARIRPTLTFWNIDPEGDVPLLLQLGTARRRTDSLKDATQAVAEFVRRDSDHTLLVTPRITTSNTPGAAADAPIAIYFSGSGDAEKNQSGLLSISPMGDEISTYQNQLLTGVYQLVRRGLLNVGGIFPPQPPANPEQPGIDFTRKVTRLHWKIFAQALTQPRDPARD